MAEVLAVPYVNLYTFALTQRYFYFYVQSELETLFLNSSLDGGATFTWQSLGRPPEGVLNHAAATAFFAGELFSDGSVINQFYAFGVGIGGDHLWANVSLDDGKTWNWQNQGSLPSGAKINGRPDAVSRQSVKGGFEQDTYCYVIGSDGHLYVNYSEDTGATWHWADRGAPTGATLAVGRPSTLAYFDGTVQRIYTFAIGNDNNLYVLYGDGSTWTWLNLGHPPSGGVSNDLRDPTSVTVPPAESIFVFVIGIDGHLWVNYSGPLASPRSPVTLPGPSFGTGWSWKDLGTPPTTGIYTFFPNALLVGNESKAAVFNWNLFVFVVGNDGSLWMNSTPHAELGLSAAWTWQPLGTPPSPPSRTVAHLNGAVASTETEATLASVQMYVFVLDSLLGTDTCRWHHTLLLPAGAWTWHEQKGGP